MLVGPGGYLGAVRLPDGRIDLAAAIDARSIGELGGAAQVVGQIVRSALGGRDGVSGAPNAALRDGLLRAIESAVWRGTPPLTRSRTALQWRRTLVVGDSAGYVEPFTGEGMGWALAGGVAAAGVALEALARLDAAATHREISAAPPHQAHRSPDEALRAWPAQWRRMLGGRRRACGVVASIARRPQMASTLISLGCAAPAIAQSVVNALGLAAGNRLRGWRGGETLDGLARRRGRSLA